MGFISNVNAVYAELDKLLLFIDESAALSLSDEELQSIIDVHANLGVILEVPAKSAEVSAQHSEVLAKAQEVVTNLESVIATKQAVDISAAEIASETLEVSTKHSEVVLLAAEVDTKNAEIKNLSVLVQSLAMGEAPSIDYNASTGVLTLGIPRGDKGEVGDKGDAFSVDIYGLASGLSVYDNSPTNTSYLAVDTSTLYFKISDTAGDWSAGVSFGKGDAGADGADLTISSIDDNLDGTYTWHFSDGTDYITSDLTGATGATGLPPAHELVGEYGIRFKNPDGTWGLL